MEFYYGNTYMYCTLLYNVGLLFFLLLSSGDGFARYNKSVVQRRVPNILDGDTGNITMQTEGMINDIPSTNMMLNIKSVPSTVMLIYISTRYSTKEPFIGYPRIEKRKDSVKLCVTSENELKVTVLSASSTEMSTIDYCVAVNSKRPLHHRCSAHMLIPKLTLSKEEKVRGFLAAQKREYEKIRDARYKCTNRTDITFKNLPLSTLSFFINVYSVNRESELSSSFPTAVWNPKDYELKKCDRNVQLFETSATGNHKDHKMELRYTTDLYIKITGRLTQQLVYNSSWYLWFQPCSIPPRKTHYTVQVQQVNPTSNAFRCKRRLTRHPQNVCEQSNQRQFLPAPGTYKVTVVNPSIKELSSVAGNLILSHTGVHGNLFPYRGISFPHRRRNGRSKNKNAPKIGINFNCNDNTLSASVFAYKDQWYCFFLKEVRYRRGTRKETKRALAKKINLCTPRGTLLNNAEQKCANNTQWTPRSTHFNNLQVTFKTRIQSHLAYAVYVYYGLKVKANSDRAITYPFYGFKYISVKRQRVACSRDRRGSNAGSHFFWRRLY